MNDADYSRAGPLYADGGNAPDFGGVAAEKPGMQQSRGLHAGKVRRSREC